MRPLEKLFNLFKDNDTGFKVVGDYWFARYSNTFEDREGEYFTTKAIDAYITRVDTGVTPAPELWVWHMPIVVGKAYGVARIGHFAVAWGTFADTTLGQAAKTYFQNNKAKLSHGFVFNPEAFKDNAYHDYNTFEITLLPFEKGVEANAYTNFEVKDMSMTPEKAEFLKSLFGEDTAQELIASTEKASKAIEDAGVRFKDFTDVEALKMDEKPKRDGETDMDNDDDDDKTHDDYKKSISRVITDLYGDVAEIADGQNTVAKALQQVNGQNRALKTLMESLQATHKKELDLLREENSKLRNEFDLTPRRASQDQSTTTDTADESNKDLKSAIQDKEASQGDGFWLGLKTEG